MRGPRLAALSDEELLKELGRLVAAERESTVEVLRHLAEVDRRRAVERTATPSLFVYCVRELGYSEGAAYRRIHAARCAREFPRVYVLLKWGRITLTTVSTLAPHLCKENYRQLLGQACGMTKYEVERLVATLEPRREMKEVIRPLGIRHAAPVIESGEGMLRLSDGPPVFVGVPAQDGACSVPPAPPSVDVRPAESRVEFRFCAGEGFLAKIRRAREVLWHKHPRGRLEDILDEAVEALLDKRDPQRRFARLAKRRRSKTRACPSKQLIPG